MSVRRDSDEHRDPALDALYHAAADEIPQPDLDRRVLASAHRAVGARPHDAASRSWLRRWSVPLSVAATLVVSVSMVSTILREEPMQSSSDDTEAQARPKPSAVQPAPPAPPASPSYAPPAPQVSPRSAPQPAPESRTERKMPAEPASASGAREREQAAARTAPALSAPSRSDRPAADDAKSITRDPGQWLDEIEAQFRRGDTEAAKRSLRAFREQFPERPVPASVQALERG